MKKICLWVLSSGEKCGEKVKYKIGRDDDCNKVRVYESFCEDHKEKAEKVQEGLEWI